MKTQLGILILGGAVILTMSLSKNEMKISKAETMKKTEVQKKELISAESFEKGTQVAAPKAPEWEDIEANYKIYPSERLELLIKSLELSFERDRIFERANRGLLSETERRILGWQMKLVTVCRKILLERKLYENT